MRRLITVVLGTMVLATTAFSSETKMPATILNKYDETVGVPVMIIKAKAPFGIIQHHMVSIEHKEKLLAYGADRYLKGLCPVDASCVLHFLESQVAVYPKP